MKDSLKIALASIFLSLFLFAIHQLQVQSSQEFQKWKVDFGKHYSSQLEQLYRQNVFMNNFVQIELHNKLNKSYKKGLNQFSDLTEEQFVAKFLISNFKQNLNQQTLIQQVVQDEPEVDWVSKGFVTNVSDQGACGACWAFSALGSVQFLYKKQKGTLTLLSAQQLLDCSGSYGNYGCNGGWMDSSFDYIRDKGITQDKNYPYKGVNQKCKRQGDGFKITGYTDIKDCTNLAKYLVDQPISVAIDATKFYNYKSGIFTDCSDKIMLNHAMVLVGMTKDYWLLKEQWGTKWGQNGYMRLTRGNSCGVCNIASFARK